MVKEAVKASWYRSIKVKLILIMIVISILPLLFLGIYNMKVTKAEIEEAVHQEYALTTVRISHTVSDLVNTLQTTLETIALINADIFHEGSVKEKEHLLYGLLKSFPHLEELAMISADGKETVKVTKRYAVWEGDLKSIEDSLDLQMLKDGISFIGRPIKDIDNQMIFTIGVPAGGAFGKFSGGIVAKVSLREVMKEISSLEISDGSYVILIDETGALIGHSDYSQVLRKQDVSKSKGVQALLEDKREGEYQKMQKHQPMIYETYTNERVLGTYGLIPIVDWGVIVEQPLEKAYSTIRSMQKRLVLILFLIISSILGLGGFFILQFMKPLNALAKGVTAVKRGDFHYRIPQQNRDELGLVVEAFNEMIEEIKKKRENEKIVIQAEKRAAIGLLAAGVAHEINNPMNNLGFYAADLLDRLEMEDIEALYQEGTIQYYLNTIKEQIERCADITSSLLNYSRETDKAIELIDMSLVVEDTLKLVQHRIVKQGIQTVFHRGELEPKIWGDKSGLQQVLLNLITNAVDAMPRGGILTIKIEYNPDKEYPFVLRVEDTGCGIPKEKLPYIFDAFYTTKPIGQGTGLGLAISQVIIERMRGSIEVYSDIGRGTQFIVKLPIAAEVMKDGSF